VYTLDGLHFLLSFIIYACNKRNKNLYNALHSSVGLDDFKFVGDGKYFVGFIFFFKGFFSNRPPRTEGFDGGRELSCPCVVRDVVVMTRDHAVAREEQQREYIIYLLYYSSSSTVVA